MPAKRPQPTTPTERPRLPVLIRMDGDSHFREGAREYDHERQTFIASFGIKILRFLNMDIYENLDGVMEAIEREILDRRVASKPPPGPRQNPPEPPLLKGGNGMWVIPPLRRGGQGG